MNRNKLFNILFAAIIVVGSLASAWQSAAASSLEWYRAVPGKTIEIGKQGVYFSNVPANVSAVLAGRVEGSLPARFNRYVDLEYRKPVIELRFLTARGGAVNDISALVYVFFDIGRAERDLWYKEGSDGIAIWYYNEIKDNWEMCPTLHVPGNIDYGTFDRLTCLAPGSGYYVLGHFDFDEEIFSPYTSQGEFVNEVGRHRIQSY